MTPDLDDLRVLVVEDHEDTLAILCFLLNEARVRTTCVGDVQSAIRTLERERPDALLSNLRMHTDGLTVVRAVREIAGNDIPAICVTGYADERHRQMALEAGFNVYVAKPFKPDQILQALRDVTGRGLGNGQ